MERIECIVTAPHVFTMAGEGVGYRPDTALAVDGGRILKVAPREEIFARYTARRILDGRNHALFPGFLDVHMHMSACLLRGMAQDVGNWMMHGFFPLPCTSTERHSGRARGSPCWRRFGPERPPSANTAWRRISWRPWRRRRVSEPR